MRMNEVFKFPDGKGGWVLKTQTADGQWANCDESGTLLKESIQEGPDTGTSVPGGTHTSVNGRMRGASSSSGKRAPKGIQFGLKIPEEFFRLVTEYVGWKAFTEHRAVHRSEVFLQGAAELIRRDKAFKAFRESLGKEKEQPI